MPAEPRRWQFGPPLDCFDRGFQYGDGVFETIEYEPAGAWLLDQHRHRLNSGAAKLGLSWPETPAPQRLLAAVEERARSMPRAVVKLFLTAAPAARGYGRPWPHPAVLRASVTELGPGTEAPAVLEVADAPLDGIKGLGGVKHLNRLPQVVSSSPPLAAAVDERLVCDRDGAIEEGTFTNFFYQLQGNLYTPPIVRGVAGVLRDALINAPELGMTERRLSVIDLPQLDGCWIGNSVMGVRAVQQIRQARVVLDFAVNTAGDVLRHWVEASRARDRQSLSALSSALAVEPPSRSGSNAGYPGETEQVGTETR